MKQDKTRTEFEFLCYKAEVEHNPINGKFTVFYNNVQIPSISENSFEDARIKFVEYLGYSIAKNPIKQPK